MAVALVVVSTTVTRSRVDTVLGVTDRNAFENFDKEWYHANKDTHKVWKQHDLTNAVSHVNLIASCHSAVAFRSH